MNVLWPAAILVCLLVQPVAAASTMATVESRNFETKSLPQPFKPPKQLAEGYQLFQASGAFLPEATVVKSVVAVGDSRIGLPAGAKQRLSADLDAVYGRISTDPLLKNIASALPYCLNDKRPTQGHYFAYYPGRPKDARSTIIFLHGFGGNFLFYTYLLKEEFPNAVILLPSWGSSWRDGTTQYLDDMLKDVRRRRSIPLGKPWLMAISAGGPAGFRLYNQQPSRFSGLVSLASAPSQTIIPKLNENLKILMLNGREDNAFPIAAVERTASRLRERLPMFEAYTLPGDHFFLLSHQAETFRRIREFLEEK